jgi:hypothetical protein
MGPAGGFPRVQGRVIGCDAARHADTRSSKCMIVFSRLLGLTDTSPVYRTCIASNIYPLTGIAYDVQICTDRLVTQL